MTDRCDQPYQRALAGFVVLTALTVAVPACRTAAPVPAPTAAAQPSGSRPAPPDPARFADEIRRFVEWDQRNSFPADAVLFVGSSTIRMWPTAGKVGDRPVVNRGFGGSMIPDVNHYFDQVVKPYAAGVIVFYAGDNDIAAGRPPEQVRDDFAEFVRRVRADQPRTPIVFLSIKPSVARWSMWPQMQAANGLVRALAEQSPDLHYIDVASPLLGPDGQPDRALYLPDGLHLSPAGYRIWDRILAPRLTALAGELEHRSNSAR